MGRIIDGVIVLTEEESRKLLEIHLRERNRPTTKEDEDLIYNALHFDELYKVNSD